MPPNHKFTNVLKGRTVTSIAAETGKVMITFEDGSVLAIKSGAPRPELSGSVAAVFEAEELQIKLDGGLSQTFLLADPGASVSVRDKNGAIEYLGWS
jgi:hypothetical protein